MYRVLIFQDHESTINLDGFNGTIAGQELFNELRNSVPDKIDTNTICFGHIMLWSDSFLRCYSRQKDNSIWILVARVSPPLGCSASEQHTFCLAFGSSKQCHDKVIAYYLKEIKHLMKGKNPYYGRPGIKRKLYTFKR